MNQKSVIINFIWKFAERGLAQVIGFVISLVLARLIDPSAYGTLALATVFISILNVFVDCGLGTALVQRKEADDLDFSTVFYVNLLMCLVIYGLVFFGAPLVSRFYENPALTPIVRASGLILPVSGLRSVQQAYVERTMQFKKFFLSTLLATVLSGVLGLVMAYKGYGVWALVAMNVANVAVGTIVLWITVKWRPRLQFSMERLKPLLSFGSKVLGSSIVITVYSNSRQLLVGKFYTTSDLAFYNKGNSLPNCIVPTLQSSITSVLLPTVSRYQDDLQRVRELTGKAISALSMILWPMMIGMAACAEVFVPLTMTEKWMPAVPYMQLFCVEAAIWPMSSIYVNSIRAIGKSGLDFKLQTGVRVTGILLLLLMIPYGPFAVALCAFLCTLIEYTVLAVANKKVLAYPIWQQLKNILPFAGMSLVMGAVVFLIGRLAMNRFLLLVLQILCGVIVYGVLILLFRRDMIQDFLKLFLKKKQD